MTPVTSLYAIWYDRLIAYLVDMFLLAIPGALAVAMMSSADAQGELVVAPASAVVVFCINMGYFVFFLSGAWQATPGMRLMSIHLIRTDGRTLTQRDGLERFLAFVIPSLPLNVSFMAQELAQLLTVCLNILWFVPILTTRIGMHDRLCDMRVINGKLP